MSELLTESQVQALAPDPASFSAGRGLAGARNWKSSGLSDDAVWGECQGSALYQVRVSRVDWGSKCSCPSRKFPCKHVMGLLLLAARGQVSAGTPPDWTATWIAERAAKAEKKAQAPAAESAPDLAAQARRAAARVANVTVGFDGLDLWMADLVRQGLATLEGRPQSDYETQAARLVDAQAPALAEAVRGLGELVGGRRDWPERVLAAFGRLALLSEAWRRLDALPVPLQHDLRALVGIPLATDVVQAEGERVSDTWQVLFESAHEATRVTTLRTWLRGRETGRDALILQFLVAGRPRTEFFVPGGQFAAELVFWPSAFPLRAMVGSRAADAGPGGVSSEPVGRQPGGVSSDVSTDPLPGAATLAEVLEARAVALAAQPFLDRLPVCLRDVVPAVVRQTATYALVDTAAGGALPLSPGDHAALLAVSGGAPLTVAGELCGEFLEPFAATDDRTLWHRGADGRWGLTRRLAPEVRL